MVTLLSPHNTENRTTSDVLAELSFQIFEVYWVTYSLYQSVHIRSALQLKFVQIIFLLPSQSEKSEGCVQLIQGGQLSTVSNFSPSAF